MNRKKLCTTGIAVLVVLVTAGCSLAVSRNSEGPALGLVTTVDTALDIRDDALLWNDHWHAGDSKKKSTNLFPVMLKDPGTVDAPAAPTPVNDVTFTRYRVVYTRTDGRNTPGVDVPYPFDSAATFTASPGTLATAGFDLVRVVAKEEPPLRALINNPQFIATIAEVTFYGKDRAGHDVTASGSIGITFGNFGDPE